MRPHLNRIALRTSLIYGGLAIIWILLSDTVLDFLVSDPLLMGQIQTYKGSAFVVVTAVLLYVGLTSQLRRQHHDREELAESEDARDRSLSLMTATLESTKDGILAVSRDGRIETFNRLFARMWNLDPAFLAHSESRVVLEHVRDQLQDPDAFIARTQQIYREQEKETFDTVEFKDGRVFERYSRQQQVGGQILGRVWSFRDITERRRAEEALRESEQRFRQLVDHAPDAIVVLDMATGRFTEVNPAAERMFKLTAAELRQLGPADLSPPRQPDGSLSTDQAQAYLARALAGEVPVFEWMHRDAEQHEFLCELRLMRFKVDGREMVRGSLTEITERKQAEQTLRDSEERFHALFAESPLVIMLTDLQTGRIADANRMAENLLGFRLEEARGRTTADLNIWHHPTDRDLYVETLRANGVIDGLEVQINRSDGTFIDMMLHGQTIIIAGQDYVLTSAVDITKRKQIEAELRWRTAFFEAQLESSVDGILVVDEKNRKIVQNRRMVELWKIPPEFAAEEDDTRQVRYCTQRTKNPQQFLARIEHLYAHPREVCDDEIELDDGTVLSRYTAGVWDSEGKYYGRIWAFRDITERQQLEGRLRQAQKMEAIGQLAGGVAHDFNNLLTAIVGHLGLIRTHEDLDADITESLEQISGAAKRAANLTSQLLTFSRRQVLSTSDLDLNTVVTQLTKMLRRVLGEHITMHVDYAADQLLFRGDAGMIDQVLVNLAVNARDAMPDGGTLRIATASVMRPDENENEVPYVHLAVSDTGTGISSDILPHIFEPFYTTKEIGKGTGLGLATVFGIIEQHQGTIEVDSIEGHGTTFHVYIPQITAAESAAEAEAAAEPVSKGQGETILLVEDEAAVRDVGVRTLRRFGYRVLTANSGPDALAVWSEHQDEVDLLLTDMIMPGGLSGLQLARQLSAEKPGLRVIYTSGYSADIAGKDHLMRDGVNYLAKPYEVTRLCQIVRTALDSPETTPPL